MPVIHLIRHGQTDGNRSHYVGRKDLDLNAAGLAQAEALAGRLGFLPIGRIIVSPLRRAVQTAAPLAQRLGLKVEVHAGLAEIDFGDLQDMPKSGHPLDLRRTHALVPLPGGESLRNLWDRLLPLASMLEAADREEGEVALVGHYWSNRMLHGRLSGSSFDETLSARGYKPETGSAVAIWFRV